MLDVEATFCYLGDMLCSSGGIAARCVAWGKFKKLFPVLTTRHFSPRIRGKVYGACVHSAMLHGSETWGLNNLELQQFRRDDRALIRWICGIKDGDEISKSNQIKSSLLLYQHKQHNYNAQKDWYVTLTKKHQNCSRHKSNVP